MNVFEEKPLNLAHAYERKAKKCLQTKDYEMAAAHYQEASTCISKAMDKTYSVKCYSILCFQYDKYTGSISKCRHLLAQEPEPVVECEEMSKTESMPLPEMQLNPCKEHSDPLHLVETDHSLLLQQREPDSLLQFLNPSPTVKKSQKLPKTKDDIIEELQIANENLKQEIANRVKHEEKLKNENKLLQNQITYLELQLKELQSQVNANSPGSVNLVQDLTPQSFLFNESHFTSSEKFEP